jgi:hypothetical protein
MPGYFGLGRLLSRRANFVIGLRSLAGAIKNRTPPRKGLGLLGASAPRAALAEAPADVVGADKEE